MYLMDTFNDNSNHLERLQVARVQKKWCYFSREIVASKEEKNWRRREGVYNKLFKKNLLHFEDSFDCFPHFLAEGVGPNHGSQATES